MNGVGKTGRSSRGIVVLLLVWLAIALAVGAARVLARAPVPPPFIAFALVALTLLGLLTLPVFRARVFGIGFVPLVAFHFLRLFAGMNFLWLTRRGVLPPEFALTAGWGDIFVGVSALLVLWGCLPLRTVAQRTGLLTWNTLGLVDILLVLANGLRMFSTTPELGQAFTNLPLSLLPTFVVPIVLVTHLLLFVKIARLPRRLR